jgi:hypothetical protein
MQFSWPKSVWHYSVGRLYEPAASLAKFGKESFRQQGAVKPVALRKSLSLSCLEANYANTEIRHLVIRRL